MGNVCNNMAGTCNITQCRRGGGTPSGTGTYIYPSKIAALVDLSTKLDKYPTTKDATYNPTVNYTSDFNSWIMATHYTKTAEQKVHATSDEGITFFWLTRRNIEWAYSGGTIKLHVMSQSQILKDTQNRTSWQIFKKVREMAPKTQGVVTVQGDDGQPVSQESIQGQPDQQSDKQASTIITADTTIETSVPVAHKDTSKFASTEPITTYNYLTSRWMPYKTFTVDTSHATGYELMTIWLPAMIYKEASCAPNNIPFETFVYGKMDIDIKIVLNGNKFQVGKIVASPKFDTYQADSCSDGYQGSLSRNHVILDIPARNEGVLSVPFVYHRAFVRLAKTANTSKGVRSGKYATVSIKVLSPLKVGTGNTNSCLGQVFYRFRNAEFTGLSYRVTLQGDNMGDALAQSLIPTQTLKAMVRGAEVALEQLGKTDNQDKPTSCNATIIVPQPRRFFCATGGLADCVPLKANPLALTTFAHTPVPRGEPRTTIDIARIWGLWKDFKWSATNVQPNVLFDQFVDPSIRFTETDYIGAPTPLEYICGMYQFWSGTIELRFDFVSNTFHTGAVLISVEFNRPLTTETMCAAASSYTTTFHLGEQKSVQIVVPYIYDTVYRRNNGVLINDNFDTTTTTNLKSRSYSVASMSQTRVRVVVLNGLRLPETVTNEINVMVFMRAGKDFALMSLKPTAYVDLMADGTMDSFPRDYAGEVYTEPVMAQMDNGEKDNKDETAVHSTGPCAQVVQNVDGNLLITSILRRPICIVDSQEVKQTTDSTSGFFIPLQPPSRSFVKAADNETTFTPSAARTAHAALLNLWRHWRGSMRYTIVLNSPSAKTFVAITHLPHSGTRLRGNQLMGAKGSIVSPYKMGFATEFLLPSVNPSAHVEVPYETENDWTLMFEEKTTRNYTWRDKGDTNSGHLVIQSLNDDAKISVWWAAGDDFEVANWYGIPWCKANDVQYRLDDNVAKVETFTKDNITVGTTKTEEVKLWYAQRRKTEEVAASTTTAADTARSTTTPAPTSQGDVEVVVPPEILAFVRKHDKEQRKKKKKKRPDAGVPVTQGMFDAVWSYFTSDATNSVDPMTGWTYQEREQNLATMSQELRSRFFEIEAKGDLDTARNFILEHFYKVPVTRARIMGATAKSATEEFTESVKQKVEDFRNSDVLTRVSDVIAQPAVKNLLLGAVPVVGTGLAAARIATHVGEISDTVTASVAEMTTTVDGVAQSMGDVCAEVQITAETVRGLAPHVQDLSMSLSALASKLNERVDVVTQIMTQVSTQISSLFSTAQNAVGSVFGFLLDLVIAWVDRSWTAVGVGIVRLIVSGYGVGVFAKVSQYATELGRVLSEFFSRRTGVTVQADTEDQTAITLVSVLAGVIGTVVGVAVRPSAHSFMKEALIRLTQTSGISYFIQVMNFVKATFKTVKNMVYSALGLVNPEVQALQALSGQSETIKTFLQNAQTITNEANTALLYVPEYRVKFWQTVLQAQRLQQIMVEVPNSCVSPVLSKMCADVVKIGNEKFLDLAACPVRYEPYVVCITGPSGVGKSHMTNKLIVSLLDRVGYKAPASGVAYFRTPLSQYWSGYRDQPVVVFDEWMHMNDANACALQLAELYQLKSTSPFIPNMAHLEEKRIRGNPLIVVLLCNDAFPALDQVHCKDAVWRRRDEVIRVAVKEEFEGISPRELTPEQQDNYDHLEFVRYTDSTDKDSDNTEGLGFEAFTQYMRESFARYHQQEKRNVARQMDQLNQLNRNVPADAYNIRDPFAVFYSGTTSMPLPDTPEWVPTERLRADIDNLVALLDQAHAQQVQEEVVEPPRWGTGVEYPRVGNDHEFDEGMPNAQIDPGLVAIAAGHLAISLAPRVFGYLWASIRGMTATVSEWTHCLRRYGGLKGTCSVCYGENAEITHICNNVVEHYATTHEILHATCGPCYARMRASGNRSCAVCRGPMRPITTNEESRWWMRVLLAMQSALDAGTSMAEFVAQVHFLASDWARWWFWYEIMLDATTMMAEIAVGGPALYMGVYVVIVAVDAVVHVADTYYRDVPLWPSFNYNIQTSMRLNTGATDIYGRPLGSRPNNWLRQWFAEDEEDVFVVQADEGDPVAPVPPLEDPFELPHSRSISYELLERRARRESPEDGPCLHQLMVGAVDNAVYNSGWWMITHQGARVRVWDGPCKSPHCAWKPQPTSAMTHTGVGLQRFFYRLYLRERQQQIRASYVAWSNAQGPQRDYIRNKLPPVFRPEWMQNPLELDVPTQNLVSTSWWQWLSDAYQSYRHVLEIIAIAAVASGLLYTAWCAGEAVGLFGTAAGGAVAGVTLGAVVQSPPEQQGRQHQSRTRATRMNRGTYFATSQSDATVAEVAGRYIQNNTLLVKLLDSNDRVAKLLHAIGLYNHQAIMPGHYVDTIIEWEGQIVIENMQRPYLNQVYRPSRGDFRQSEVNDIALWTVPASVNCFKDIRRFLAKDADLDKPLAAKGTLYVVPTRHLPSMVLVEVDITGIVNNMVANNPSGGEVTILDALEYNFSKPGACGSLLLLENNQRPIVSMHVAGTGEGLQGVGYGLILTQEALGEMEQTDLSVPESVATQGEDTMEIVWPPAIQVEYHGSVKKEEKPWSPNKSKLRRSAVHGAEGLAVDIEPAILSATDPRYVHDVSPLIAGCEAHGRLTENFPSHWLRGPKQHLKAMITSMKPLIVKPRVLSESEAIVGLDVPYYDPIDVNTSAGYPLTLRGKTSKKEWMSITRDESERMTEAHLEGEAKELYDLASATRKTGVRYSTIFTDTLKDEKRPKAKLMKRGGTRVFCNGPLEHMLHMRRHFMHFSSAFMMNRRKMMHAVGINPCGTEWDQLARDLIAKGKKICTLDYSNFGPGFNACVANVVLELIAQWTLDNVEGCDANEVYALLAECGNSVHIAGNTVYSQTSGSPSGAVLTTVINSLVNMLYILVAWEQLAGSHVRANGLGQTVFESFKTNVALFVYGDDLVMAVSDLFAQIFNSRTITEFFKKFKIAATDASKTEVVTPYTSLVEAEFLKRTWVRHPFRRVWMSRLRMATLQSTTQWVWQSPNNKEATRLNCEVACLLAHGLGPAGFEKFVETVNKALTKAKLEPLSITWDEVDENIYEYGSVQVY